MIYPSAVPVFLLCSTCALVSLFVLASGEQQFMDNPQQPLSHQNVDNPSMQRDDHKVASPSTGTRFQGGPSNVGQQHAQPTEHRQGPLHEGDPQSGATNQKVHTNHDSTRMHLQVSDRLTEPQGSLSSNSRSSMGSMQSDFGSQHAQPDVQYENQRVLHQQKDVKDESLRFTMGQVHQAPHANIPTGRDASIRLDQGRAHQTDSVEHINFAHSQQQIPGTNTMNQRAAIPSQTFHQPNIHQAPGIHSPEAHSAGQFQPNPQFAPSGGDGRPTQHIPGHDFVHRGAVPPNYQEDAPDAYNQLRHIHGMQDHLQNQPRTVRPNADIPREFRLDNAYAFPSVDEHRRSRSLSDDFVSLTLMVEPSTKECAFYVPVANFILDYQVIRGGLLDIGLFVKDPQGEPIATRLPSPDGTLSIKVPPHFQLRPYAICFDNRKASYSGKYVSFSIDLDLNWDNPNPNERAVIEALRKRSFDDAQAAAMDAEYTESWKALSDRMESLFGRLRRIEHLQQKTDNFASVDKALMEGNADRVLRGSLIQIFIMIAVASVQTLLIRAFFDFNSRFYRFWFGKRSQTSARC